MNYKIAQLMLSSNQKGATAGDVYVAQEDGRKEDLAGKLFVLIEVETSGADEFRLIDFFINNLNHFYYQNEKILLRERVATLQVEHIFESALIKTNKTLAEFVKNEKINLDPGKLNITAGLVFDNEIHFTTLGKNRAFLIHRRKNEEEFIITEITDKAKEGDEDTGPTINKLFPAILSGAIPTDGYFLLTNEALPEYISSKQLSEIITTLPPAGAIEQIKNNLLSINDYVAFSAVLIKNSALPERKEVRLVGSHNSIQNLRSTENTTEKFLSPSGVVNLKQKIDWQRLIGKLGFFKDKAKKLAQGQALFLTQEKISFRNDSFRSKVGKSIGKLSDLGVYFLNLLFFIGRSLKNFRSFPAITINLLRSVVKNVRLAISFVSGLNRWQKTAVAVVFLCLGFFTVNLFFQSRKNLQQESEQKYAELTQQIEKKQNEVDASLLYNDDNRAKNLFGEINSLISQLPQTNAEQQAKVKEFQTKYSDQMLKASKMTKIDNPTVVADWSSDGANPVSMTMDDSKNIYAIDNDRHIMLKFATASDKLGANAVEGTAPLTFPATFKTGEIYFFNGVGLTRWTEKETKSISPTPPLTDIEVAAMAGFNNRVYIVDKKSGQILKYEKLANGGTGTAWLKSPIDLSSATALAIDGKLYVLFPDKVLAFSNGNQEDITLEPIIPPLSQATRLLSSSDTNRLYVLEPKNKRVVIFSKSGKMLAQFTADIFDSLKDIAVDESAKRLFVLNGRAIYSIDVSPIK